MRPPRGFEAEKFPLRHNVKWGTQLNMGSDNINTVFMPIVRSSADAAMVLPNTIKVNPHNSDFEEDSGPLCAQMSIIDRLTISLKFAMTSNCDITSHTSGLAGAEVFTGDNIPAFNFLWRPIFNVYPEKMDAADDDTGTTVAAILGMTKDATNEDVVPVTTFNLAAGGPADFDQPNSTSNDVEVFGDYNLTDDFIPEAHVFDEDLLQQALRHFTNKGALRSCLGRTRHVTLTRNKPYKNFYISKFVPNAIRRVQPFALMGIQVHMPLSSHVSQVYQSATTISTTLGHLGVKMISHYHEWNSEHDQERGTPS